MQEEFEKDQIEDTEKIQENVKPANKKVIGFNFILIVVIFVRIIHLYDKCRWYRQYN